MKPAGSAIGTHSWKIRSPGDHCLGTGAPFRDGDVFYSCLLETGDALELVREDYCEAAWPEVRSKRNPFSFWRSVYETKPAPAQEDALSTPHQDDFCILQRLMEEGDPATEKARYFLALRMERGKLLRQIAEERRSGRNILFYEHLPTGEILLIPDPEIRLDQISEVEGEIGSWPGPQGSIRAPYSGKAI